MLLAARVWSQAWVSEDAFTFRYVTNLLDGHGAVFNIGRHVQGYTHPLWFILLALACVPYRDPVIVSTLLSLAFTVALVVVFGRELFRRSAETAWPAGLLTLFVLLCATSRSWVSFQTSGLENSLSNLLLAILAIQLWSSRAVRPATLGLVLGLLGLTRPDFLLIVTPVGLAYAVKLRRIGDWIGFAAGLGPSLVWAAFAWLYYGTVVTNTAPAKIGLWSSWQDGLGQGWAYVVDLTTHEPVSVLVATGLLAVAYRPSKHSLQRALLAGVVLYALYVVWIGGDFMRGRMLLPVLVTGGLTGILASSRSSRAGQVAIAVAAVLLVTQAWITRSPSAEVSDAGIVDEQAFYPGHRLSEYLDRGRIVSPYLNLDFADELRAFAERCGPVTIHARNPGTIAYLSGPEVSVIDTLGLTDAFIARLPRSSLVARKPRPGHPDKVIPLSYLGSRKDISIVPDWELAVKNLDCSVIDRAFAFASSPGGWEPD
jgi:arabinofuranosyltransferase